MTHALKRHLAVIGAYGPLTLLMAWPAPAFLTDYVIGAGGDPWQTMWRMEEKAAGGFEVFLDDLLGRGEPRLVNLSAWPWIWAQYLFGQPLAYNVVWILSSVLAGYGMYLLVSVLTAAGPANAAGKPAAAFLAGIAYMFWPYRIAHAQGHFGAMQTGWLPLIILLAILLVRRPTVWRLLGLAALVTIQAWTEHHYMLWLALLALLAGWWFRHELRVFWQERQGGWHALALAGLLVVFIGLPYWPTVELALAPASVLALGDEQTVRFSADLFSYGIPAAWQPIWGAAAYAIFSQHFTGNLAETTHFLGLLPLLLVIFFWKTLRRQQLAWWGTVAAVFAVISLGPRLHLLGWVTPLPLPFALIDAWPTISSVRAVARAGVLVGLAWFVLFALVLQGQLKRTGAAAVVGAVVLLEFLFMPVPLQSTRLSKVYTNVAQAPGTRVVEIPAATNYAAASRALYASRRHGKEVVGNIALERAAGPDVLDEARSLPALRQLLFLRTQHLLEDRTDFFDQRSSETLPDVLHYLDAPVIVVHPDSLAPGQLAAVRHVLEAQLQLTPEKAGEELLYTVPAALTGDKVFLARDDRWTGVGFDKKRNATFAQVVDEAGVTVYNLATEPKLARFHFEIAEESEGSLAIVTESETIRPDLQAAREITVDLRLAPGQNRIVFKNQLPGPLILQNPRLSVP